MICIHSLWIEYNFSWGVQGRGRLANEQLAFVLYWALNLRLKEQPKTKLENETEQDNTQETKLLGVVIDARLHVNWLCNNMGNYISVLRRHRTSEATKILIYVWSSAAPARMAKLQKIQNRAACIVLGCNYMAEVVKMQKHLGWWYIHIHIHES